MPYIKGLSEQYRHTLAKYRIRAFFKGTSTIKSLLMHPKDPIPDAQKTDIIYHWKCPANNCTAEYIGETNRSLKERVSDHGNQTNSAIRNHHISKKDPKAELRFHNNRQRQQHPTTLCKRRISHSYQRSITQEKHWQSQNPFHIQKTSQTFHTTRTSHPSNKHRGKQFHISQSVIFSREYIKFKFFDLLISSSNRAEEGTS